LAAAAASLALERLTKYQMTPPMPPKISNQTTILKKDVPVDSLPAMSVVEFALLMLGWL
jgi:hypothetical protein